MDAPPRLDFARPAGRSRSRGAEAPPRGPAFGRPRHPSGAGPARAAVAQRPVRRKAPGTCGELVQGALNGRDFLVNCPIDLFSRATVQAAAAPGLRLRDPERHGKVLRAVALLARRRGLRLRHEASVESAIPRGKGMASSTADLCAALDAVCRSCGEEPTAEEVAAVLAAVEPSDCVHFPGVSLVNHLTGELLDTLPVPDGLRVLVVDCGGEVDTVAFDRDRARGVYRENGARVAGMLHLLRRGLRGQRREAVAEAATRSAELSQRILRKPQFEELLSRAREIGALGVNCAHSGTVLGVLHRAEDCLAEELAACVERRFGRDLPVLGDFRFIGGGCTEQ